MAQQSAPLQIPTAYREMSRSVHVMGFRWLLCYDCAGLLTTSEQTGQRASRPNSGLVALACAGLAFGVVSRLLACVGPGEFSAFVRCGGDSYVRRAVDEQRFAAIEPGGFVGGNRHTLGYRRRGVAAFSPALYQRDGISVRRDDSAVDSLAVFVSYHHAGHPALVTEPLGLRSARVPIASGDCTTSDNRFPVRDSREEFKFRAQRSIFSSPARSRSDTSDDYLPRGRLGGLPTDPLGVHAFIFAAGDDYVAARYSVWRMARRSIPSCWHFL